MRPLRRITLDDTGNCVAEEIKSGVWHIHQISSFGQKRTVILTRETIKALAAEV